MLAALIALAFAAAPPAQSVPPASAWEISDVTDNTTGTRAVSAVTSSTALSGLGGSADLEITCRFGVPALHLVWPRNFGPQFFVVAMRGDKANVEEDDEIITVWFLPDPEENSAFTFEDATAAVTTLGSSSQLTMRVFGTNPTETVSFNVAGMPAAFARVKGHCKA